MLMNSARNTLFNRDVNFTAADSSKVRERSPLPPPQPRPIPVRQCHGPTLPLAPISFKHIILTRPNVHETRLCRARETNHASFLASLRLSHNHVAVSTPSLRRPSQAGEPNQVILNSRPHSFEHAGGPPPSLRIWTEVAENHRPACTWHGKPLQHMSPCFRPETHQQLENRSADYCWR